MFRELNYIAFLLIREPHSSVPCSLRSWVWANKNEFETKTNEVRNKYPVHVPFFFDNVFMANPQAWYKLKTLLQRFTIIYTLSSKYYTVAPPVSVVY